MVVLVGLAAGIIYSVAMTLWVNSTKVNNFAPVILLPTENPTEVAAAAPVATQDVVGSVYPQFLIPAAGISQLIIQLPLSGDSWAVKDLGMNVGHLIGTAPLMSTGNIVLVGHVELADGRPGIFAGLKDVTTGELILLKWHGEQRAYSVSAVKSVPPDDVSVLYPTEQEQLTLITCGDYDFFSNTYRERVVVIAPRVS